MAAAGELTIGMLAESFLVFYLASPVLQLALRQLQTLVFAMSVFSGQAIVYLVWVRRPCGLPGPASC